MVANAGDAVRVPNGPPCGCVREFGVFYAGSNGQWDSAASDAHANSHMLRAKNMQRDRCSSFCLRAAEQAKAIRGHNHNGGEGEQRMRHDCTGARTATIHNPPTANVERAIQVTMA